MSLRSSEDLGIACELKGIGQNKHCNMKNQFLHRRDYSLIALAVIVCAASLYLEYVCGGSFINKAGHP